MPHITVNGVDLYWELHGPEDGEPLVLNNGVFMSTASWALQVPELARRYRVLVYDMRGQGQSAHPDDEVLPGPPCRRSRGAHGCAGDRTGAHGRNVLYGGELNLLLGLRHRPRCQTLVVIASVSHSEPALAATIARWRAAADAGDGAAFFQTIAPDVYSQAFLASPPEWLAQPARVASFDLRAATRLIDSFMRFDIRARLADILVPTCIVSAEHDVLKPRHYGDILHAAIAGSEFHLVPNAGHAVVLERPGEINSLVLGFLARHPMTRPAPGRSRPPCDGARALRRSTD